MKRANDAYAQNFGLVGKTVRKYLATSALTAGGLIAIASPALADDNTWSQHEYTQGSATVDTSILNQTNIKLQTSSVTARGDGDIRAGHTVNIDGQRYILFDIENDPSVIQGNLNSNGEVFIFDQNGVIFGAGSQVNVGSIIASSGTFDDAAFNGTSLKVENVGAGGNIELNGSITVAEAGIAAFVAPQVANNGIINAKLGNVVLASGNAVTLDMYGDGLVKKVADAHGKTP